MSGGGRGGKATVTGRSGSKWKQTRHDQYYFLAKEQGYRSRAAFKLLQLNKKFDFLSKCQAVVDLCAAPGGWLQVCQQLMPSSSVIIGVDLLPIKKIPNVITFVEDITTEKCKSLIKKELRDGMVDCVLHDGAPNVGGATWSRDAYQQMELVLASLKLATQFLRQGGTFITKVFRSQDYNALLWALKQFFKQTTVSKPPSSRIASAEIFVVCQGYLAPKKIDPKLLNPLHVFSSTDTKKPVDVLHGKTTKKRNREGYDDDVGSLLHKKGTVANFIEGHSPGEFLGMYNCLEFDDVSAVYLNHASTTPEIKSLCQDLKVLGKADFSNLMKWRKKLLTWKQQLSEEKTEKKEEKVDKQKEGESELTKEEQEELEEQKITQQLELLRARKIKEEKKVKRQKHEKMMKAKKKRLLNQNNLDADGEEEEDLFGIGAVAGPGTVELVHVSGERGPALKAESSEDDGPEESSEDENNEGGDKMSADLDHLYEQYKERRKIVTKQDKKKVLEPSEDETRESAAPIGPTKASRWYERDAFKSLETAKHDSDKDSSSSDDEDETNTAENGTMPDSSEESDSDDDGASAPLKKQKKTETKTRKITDKKKTGPSSSLPPPPSAASASASASADSDDEDKMQVGKQRQKTEEEQDEEDNFGPPGPVQTDEKESQDFEEVPMSEYSSDSDAEAERKALGTMMLRKKKRNEVIEAAYNRYAFNDSQLLPDWFRDEEAMHNVGSLPITKEMVDAFKNQQKAINARTSKKVSQAVHRKKKRAMAQYDKLKKQASKAVNNSETTFKDKMKLFEKLSKKKSFKNKRPNKEYLVGRKSGGAVAVKSKGKSKKKGPTTTKVVDRRQRKDTRGEKAAESKKKGGKKHSRGKR